MFYGIKHSAVAEDVVEGVNRTVYAMEERQILSERQAIHEIEQGTTTEVGLATIYVEHRRTGKDDVQRRVHVVHKFQFSAPTAILVHLVNIKMRSALLHKPVGKVEELMVGKVDVVGCDVEAMVFGRVLYALQYHCRLADASRAKYSHQTTIPTNLVILITHECGGRLLKQFAHVFIKFYFYHSL